MSLFPLFLKLDGRLAVVIGAGRVAKDKIDGLLQAGAAVRVVAPDAVTPIRELAAAGKVEWRKKSFAPSELQEAFLVVAATSAPGVNESVYREAQRRKILCNAADDIKHCHFYYGAVVRRGDLQIAISTNGKSPALAQRLRKELEQLYPPEYAAWLEWLGATREVLQSMAAEGQRAVPTLQALASRAMFEQFFRQERSGLEPGGVA